MAALTLKSLHAYLRLLENAPELKRKMPTAAAPRTMKEALAEISRLVGVDLAAFKDPQAVAALIGAQRFVMIWGEPSVTDHVAHVFDCSKVLWTVLIDPAHFDRSLVPPSSHAAGHSFDSGAAQSLAVSGPAPSEAPLENLKPLLQGKLALSCRLFRALFEHMLGFWSPTAAQQGNVSLVSELTGSREHSRSFLSTALFILGAEVDHDQLLGFMREQDLLGLPIFEHMLYGRNCCDAHYAFRRLERAFIGSPADEEAQLRNRIDKFMAQFGGNPDGAKLLEVDELDKARVDACLAATDLLEALALTPWRLSLKQAISVASSNCTRSIKTVARHFERFANGVETKDQANQEIADHLLAFARQFSADPKGRGGFEAGNPHRPG